MRIVDKFGGTTTTYTILKMDTLDREAITEHVGPVKGDWICYDRSRDMNSARLTDAGELAMLWAEITPEMCFATQREAELYAHMMIYRRAFKGVMGELNHFNSQVINFNNQAAKIVRGLSFNSILSKKDEEDK